MGLSTFTIETPVIDPSTWTAIQPPFTYSALLIDAKDATDDIKFRTDQNDSDTETTIPAGEGLMIGANYQKYQPLDIIGYLQPASGLGPVKLMWT